MKKEDIVKILKERFEENTHYHTDVLWEDVEKRFTDKALESLIKMEVSGGEPDLVRVDKELDQYVYFETFKETPENRGSITYDQKSEDIRLKAKMPTQGNAITLCENMNTELLNEEDYFYLQSLDDFDLKTSVWLLTDDEVRSKGGAIFGDKRYGRTFIYHNGAQSFYKSRGFRSKLAL